MSVKRRYRAETIAEWDRHVSDPHSQSDTPPESVDSDEVSGTNTSEEDHADAGHDPFASEETSRGLETPGMGRHRMTSEARQAGKDDPQGRQGMRPTTVSGRSGSQAHASSCQCLDGGQCDCGADAGIQFAFAIGKLGYTYASRGARDSIAQQMRGANPDDADEMLVYLDANPSEAESLIWLLQFEREEDAFYAIRPSGAFADEAYGRLRQFLGEQLADEVDRVSIGGRILGMTATSGQVLPVIAPQLRCMYSWNTAALAEAVVGKASDKTDTEDEGESDSAMTEALQNFLDMVYYSHRNEGKTPEDICRNFAITDATRVGGVVESALKEHLQLDSITVEPSPIGRGEEYCGDVKLTFFRPEEPHSYPRRVFQFTVCVAACPYFVGPTRSWYVR